MKLSCLRAFVAAAQYGSFTRAAEHLFLSQSALSRQIRELETELGVRLFERDNKKEPRLSAEGQLLLANAMEIVESCDRFPRLVSGSGGKVAVNLRVGIEKSFDTGRIYQVIAEIHRLDPEAEVQIRQASVPDLERGLREDQFHAVFSASPSFTQMEGVSVLPFLKNRLQVAVSERHPLAARRLVSVSELRGERFALPKRFVAPAMVDRIIVMCVNNGFSPDVQYYGETVEELMEWAPPHDLVFFIFSEMVPRDMEKQYRARLLEIEGEDVEFDLNMVYKAQSGSRLLAQMVDIVQAGL